MVRKVLVSTLVILALAAGVLLAITHYQNYQNKQNNTQQNAVQQLSTKVNTLEATYKAKLATEATANKQLQAECMKGLAAYNALTPTLKAKAQLPNCGSALQE